MTRLPVVDRVTLPAPLLEPVPECGVWAVSPYERCSFRCTYCITGVQGTSVPRRSRAEIVRTLRAELARLPADVRLALGALCDAYPPVEAEAGLTRAVLAELTTRGRSVSIITKGATVLRDLDLLTADPPVQVSISISSLDPEALAVLDPGAPPPAHRLAVIGELARAGVRTHVNVSPWIPGVSDVAAIAAAARAAARQQLLVDVGPLNVLAPMVAGSHFARGRDQASIDRAYSAARRATAGVPRIRWWPPVGAAD